MQHTDHTTDTFFERSPVPMCVADEAGTLQQVNPAFERALGHPAKEIEGRPLVSFVHAEDRAATRAVLQQAVRGELADVLVNRLRQPDGTSRWFEWRSMVCERGLIYATARDITERKESERRLGAQHATASALAESDSLAEAMPRILQAICENLRWDWGELWMPDESGDRLTCIELWHKPSLERPTFEQATHRTTFARGEGLPGAVWATGVAQWISDVAVDDDFVRVQATRQDGMHGGFAFPLQLSGEPLGVMAFFSRDIREPDEQVLQMLEVVGCQIGQFVERRQAEQALRKSADRLARSQRIANLGSWEHDFRTGETIWSDQMYRIYGVAPASFTPSYESVLDRIVDADRDRVVAAFHRARSSGATYQIEHRIQRPDGSVRWVFSEVVVELDENDQPARRLGIALDITERKQAEVQLHRKVELEHLVAELSTDFVSKPAYEIDAAIEDALGRIGQHVGADRSRIVKFQASKTHLNNTHEWCAEGVRPLHADLQNIPRETMAWALDQLQDDRPLIISDVAALPAAAAPMRDFLQDVGVQACLLVPLLRGRDLKGFTAFCKVEAPYRWSEDTVTLLRMMTDVCMNALQRKRIEEKLLKIQQAVESASDAIGLADPEGKPIYVNPAFTKLFGYSTAQAVHDADGPPALFADRSKGHAIMKTIMAGEAWQGHVEMNNRAGDVLQIALRGGPVRDRRGEIIGLLAIHTDITQQKQAEEALREAEKFVATGRMAAGIAHEINNPLAGIKNAFRIVQRALPDDFEYACFVQQIDREIDRISGIVRQMYSIYKPNRESASRFSICTLLENVVLMLQSAVREQGVSIEVDMEAEDSEVVLPEGSVSQVCYNLINNAIQASPEGGTVRVGGQASADTITLRVADEGPGIPPAIQSQVFEPFFSRRKHLPNGLDGMGLGLSVSRTLAESMGGRLWFETTVGDGTTFFVKLPRTQPKMEQS